MSPIIVILAVLIGLCAAVWVGVALLWAGSSTVRAVNAGVTILEKKAREQ